MAGLRFVVGVVVFRDEGEEGGEICAHCRVFADEEVVFYRNCSGANGRVGKGAAILCGAVALDADRFRAAAGELSIAGKGAAFEKQEELEGTLVAVFVGVNVVDLDVP